MTKHFPKSKLFIYQRDTQFAEKKKKNPNLQKLKQNDVHFQEPSRSRSATVAMTVANLLMPVAGLIKVFIIFYFPT